MSENISIIPIIENTILLSKDRNKHIILLIVTPKLSINLETYKLLSSTNDYPITIIFIGVGDSPFTASTQKELNSLHNVSIKILGI